MKLQPDNSDSNPGYPTFDKFKSDRRTYLARMIKYLGVMVLSSSTGIISGQSIKKKEQLPDDAIASPVRKFSKEGKPSVRNPECQVKDPDSSTTKKPAPHPPTPETGRLLGVPVRPQNKSGSAIIFIASIPAAADVYLNGKLIGKTNVSGLVLPAGVQTLRFEKGGKSLTKEFTLTPGENPSQQVRIP